MDLKGQCNQQHTGAGEGLKVLGLGLSQVQSLMRCQTCRCCAQGVEGSALVGAYV
jgi:hypothetical protein